MENKAEYKKKAEEANKLKFYRGAKRESFLERRNKNIFTAKTTKKGDCKVPGKKKT